MALFFFCDMYRLGSRHFSFAHIWIKPLELGHNTVMDSSISSSAVSNITEASSAGARAITDENWRVEKQECDRLYASLSIVEQKEFIKIITDTRRKYQQIKSKRKSISMTLEQVFKKKQMIVD